MRALIVAGVIALSMGCSLRGGQEQPTIDPVIVGKAVLGTYQVAEQAQQIEIALFLGSQTDAVAHCRVQESVGKFVAVSEKWLPVVLDITYPGADRRRALRAMVEGSQEVVELVAPRLQPEGQVALRAGLTAGLIAITALEGQRMPVEMPQEVFEMAQRVEGVMRRMALAAAQEKVECDRLIPGVAPSVG